MQFSYKWNLKNSAFVNNKGTVFSCFSGGGGSSMGYKLAGFDVIGCNEIDKNIMAEYIENLHPKYAFTEPIQLLKLRKDLPKELYHLDILDGSPPCSSFTNAGKREKDWGKEKRFKEGQALQVLDTLFFEFIDLAKKLQPKIVVAENVPGLMFGNAVKYAQRIIKEFDKAGFFVNYWLIDASVMGVPQKRKRIFFIAMRKDLCSLFGKRTGFFNMLPTLDLQFSEPKIKLKEILGQPNDTYQKLSLEVQEKWEHTKIGGYVKKFQSGACKVSANQVCPVISTGQHSHFHPYEKRTLGKKEILLIHSFPMDYTFLNERNYLFIPMMSVPPVMMAQIATRIYNQWLTKINKHEN